MEAELNSLGSQLERAKLAQGARAHRLQATGKTFEMEALGQSKMTQGIDTRDGAGHDRRHPSRKLELGDGSSASASNQQWTPQLDLSHDESKVTDKVCDSCLNFGCWALIMFCKMSPFPPRVEYVGLWVRDVMLHRSSNKCTLTKGCGFEILCYIDFRINAHLPER